MFVVGSVRSGTTLVRLILDHHSQIHGIGEFETAVSQAKGTDWPDLQEFYHFLETDRQSLAHNFDIDRSLSYEGLIHSFLEQKQASYTGTISLGAVHSRFDLLPSLWPNARYIHVVRDPRDVARSCVKMGWAGNVFTGAETWREAETRWDLLRAQTDEPRRMEVRYERFVSDPREVCTEICNFLGVDFEPAMLTSEASSTYGETDDRYANQWRGKLAHREVGWVEAQCAELMKSRGYELMSAPESLPRYQVASLRIHSRLARIVFNVEKFGFWLWLRWVVMKRLSWLPGYRKVQLQVNRVVTSGLR